MAVRDIPAQFGAHLDRVWQFVRDGSFVTNHNVFVYHWDAGAPPLIEFGVQVDRAFEDDGDIVSARTPSGTVATATHVGPYDQLGVTNDAVQQWCRDNGHATAPTNWEVYGDWNDDPTKLQTVIYQLLRT